MNQKRHPGPPDRGGHPKGPPMDPEDADLVHAPEAAELPLPHERDEAPDAGDAGDKPSQGPRQVIEQAARDLGRGLKDTERRGVPSDVPSPGPPPERSPGTAVPEEGVDRNKYAESQKRGKRK